MAISEKQIVIEARLKAGERDFVKMCLLKLYEQQEDDEQDSKDTHHENGKGFTKADAKALSRVVEYYHNGTEVVVTVVVERLLKYSKQLTTLLTDQEVGL
jgi:hypothetical protein